MEFTAGPTGEERAEQLAAAQGIEGMSSAEAKKAVSAAKLAELALVDPKRAKRYYACSCKISSIM